MKSGCDGESPGDPTVPSATCDDHGAEVCLAKARAAWQQLLELLASAPVVAPPSEPVGPALQEEAEKKRESPEGSEWSDLGEPSSDCETAGLLVGSRGSTSPTSIEVEYSSRARISASPGGGGRGGGGAPFQVLLYEEVVTQLRGAGSGDPVRSASSRSRPESRGDTIHQPSGAGPVGKSLSPSDDRNCERPPSNSRSRSPSPSKSPQITSLGDDGAAVVPLGLESRPSSAMDLGTEGERLLKVMRVTREGKRYSQFIKAKNQRPGDRPVRVPGTRSGKGVMGQQRVQLDIMRQAMVQAAAWGVVFGALDGLFGGLRDAKAARELATVVREMPIGYLKRLMNDRCLWVEGVVGVLPFPDGSSVTANQVQSQAGGERGNNADFSRPMGSGYRAAMEKCVLASLRLDEDSIRAATAKSAAIGAKKGFSDGATKGAVGIATSASGMFSGAAALAAPVLLVDVGKEAYRLGRGKIDDVEFGRRATGHTATTAGGLTLGLQGATWGAVLGPMGSLAGGILGGIVGAWVARSAHDSVLGGVFDNIRSQRDRTAKLRRLFACIVEYVELAEQTALCAQLGLPLPPPDPDFESPSTSEASPRAKAASNTGADGNSPPGALADGTRYVSINTFRVVCNLVSEAGLNVTDSDVAALWNRLLNKTQGARYVDFETWFINAASTQVALAVAKAEAAAASAAKSAQADAARAAGDVDPAGVALEASELETDERRMRSTIALAALLSEHGLLQFLQDRLFDCTTDQMAVMGKEELSRMAAGFADSVRKLISAADLERMPLDQLRRLVEDEDVWPIDDLAKADLVRVMHAAYGSIQLIEDEPATGE